MGGSFDPPTVVHLMIGEVVSHLVGQVIYVPAWHSPLKGEHLVPAEDRLEMVRLATMGNAKFRVSPVEIDRRGESHAIDTLKYFASLGEEPVFVMGSDAYRQLHQWYEFEEILAGFEVVVVSRPGCDPRNRGLRGLPKRGVTFLAGAGSGLSSTVVRDRLERGLSCRYMVPDRVLEFIAARGLYAHGDGSKGHVGGACSHCGLFPRLSRWLCQPL